MDQSNDKPLTESEFRQIFAAQMTIRLDMLVTIGTLNYVLAGQRLLPLTQMEEARKMIEGSPRTVQLRKFVSEIRESSSILEFLKNFQGPVQ